MAEKNSIDLTQDPRSIIGTRVFDAPRELVFSAFTDPDTFKENLDSLLKTLRTTKPAPGHDRVLYPGLPEYEEEQE